MNSSSERMTRGRVLSGADVNVVAADLGVVSARPARGIVVSQELIDSATREGFDAGYATGFDQGYADGIAQARNHTEILTQLAQRLSDAADALMARETTAREQIENEVVAAAFEIAATLVGHELENPDTRGRDAIARALALAPEHGTVVARLNPTDFAVIDPSHLELGRAIELVADPTVGPGDCVVDVGSCRIDARVGPALERVREVLS
jgi:flagellar assembly protein FliH